MDSKRSHHIQLTRTSSLSSSDAESSPNETCPFFIGPVESTANPARITAFDHGNGPSANNQHLRRMTSFRASTLEAVAAPSHVPLLTASISAPTHVVESVVTSRFGPSVEDRIGSIPYLSKRGKLLLPTSTDASSLPGIHYLRQPNTSTLASGDVLAADEPIDYCRFEQTKASMVQGSGVSREDCTVKDSGLVEMADASKLRFQKNNMNNSNIPGKLKDSVKIGMGVVKQDKWKVTCVKATSYDLVAPKGKYVRAIMEGLRYGGSISDMESPVGAIFHQLRKRMKSNQWIAVIKAQMIFHYIFRDGNENFVSNVSHNLRIVYNITSFRDTSYEGVTHAGFIVWYGAYLKQWLTMKATVNFPPGKMEGHGDHRIAECYGRSSMEELLDALPVIMDTIDSLLKLDLRSPTCLLPVASPALKMLLCDLSIFWITIQGGISRLLDLYFNLTISDAIIALPVYKRFVELIPKMPEFFDAGKLMPSTSHLPEMRLTSLKLMKAMREYIDKNRLKGDRKKYASPKIGTRVF